MILRDAVRLLASLPEEGTIFAEKIDGHFSPTSRALCLELTEEEEKQPISIVAAGRAPGMEYCLEVFIAREVLDGWRKEIGNERGADLEGAVERFIYYAENDA